MSRPRSGRLAGAASAPHTGSRGRPALPRATRAARVRGRPRPPCRPAREPVLCVPSAPVGRSVGRGDRSGGGCSAASRSNRASPPPAAAPRSLPPPSAGRRPLAGGRTPEFPVSWGVCDGRGRSPVPASLTVRGLPRPPPRPAPLHSGLLPSAPNLPKLRRLPPGLSYFLTIFGGFFGAIPASRSARTGYPFRPVPRFQSPVSCACVLCQRRSCAAVEMFTFQTPLR